MSDVTLYSESPFDAIRRVREDGSEYWSARDLATTMGYSRWENMAAPLNRAMKAAENTGADVTRNFLRSQKISATRSGEDFELTRFAAYLLAMNGDPNKPEVAAAQTYFAVRTREAETAPVVQQPVALPSRRELALMVVEAEDRADAAEAQVKALQPKADYVDGFVNPADDMTLIRVLANQVGMRDSDLRELLVNRDMIYRKNEGKRWDKSKGRMVNEYSWHAKAGYSAWFKELDQPEAPRLHNGQCKTTLYVTPVGKVRIAELVARLDGGAA